MEVGRAGPGRAPGWREARSRRGGAARRGVAVGEDVREQRNGASPAAVAARAAPVPPSSRRRRWSCPGAAVTAPLVSLALPSRGG